MRTRTLLATFLMFTTFSFLTACGGGDSNPSSVDGRPKNAGLRDAYFRISKGMSVEQVKAAVGGTPWYAPVQNGQIYALSYAGVDTYESLSVNFSSDRALSKTYVRTFPNLTTESFSDVFPR
jgi:hypothetical protein